MNNAITTKLENGTVLTYTKTSDKRIAQIDTIATLIICRSWKAAKELESEAKAWGWAGKESDMAFVGPC